MLIKEKSKFFTSKKVWGFMLAGALMILPFLLFFLLQFGDPIVFYTSRLSGGLPTQEEALAEGVGGVPFGTAIWFRMLTGDALRWGLVVLFLIGLTYFFKLLLGFDHLFKKIDDPEKRRDLLNRLFLFMWIFLPLIFFTFFYGLYDERYLSTSYPALFFIAGYGLQNIYKKAKKHSKPLGIAVIIFFLFFIAIAPFGTSFGKVGHIYRADSLIESRTQSQAEVRLAGIWIEENSDPGDIVIAQNEPQLMHYSRRIVIAPTRGKTLEGFEALIAEKKPRYLVLSVFEPHADWVLNYPQEHPELLTPVQAYLAPNQQPLLVVYEFNYESQLTSSQEI